MESTIYSKALLVSLSISLWTARKHDKTVSKEIDNLHSTNGAGRYIKRLIDPDAIKTIEKIRNKARVYHYFHTVPWQHQGLDMLPSKKFMDYTQKMNSFKAEFDSAISEFCNNYDQLKAKAKYELNGMFKDSDYPTSAQIANKFNFVMKFSPVPHSEDFRVSLNAEDMAIIKNSVEKELTDSVNSAQVALWKRLYDVVNAMAGTLIEPDKVFRDSLVNNIIELTEVLPDLNMMGDSALDQKTQEIRDKLTKYDAQTLRDNPETRHKIAKDARAILNSFGDYLG